MNALNNHTETKNGVMRTIASWLKQENGIGTRTMDETTTNGQVLGAALLLLAVFLLCLATVHKLAVFPAVAMLLTASFLMQDEKGGRS